MCKVAIPEVHPYQVDTMVQSCTAHLWLLRVFDVELGDQISRVVKICLWLPRVGRLRPADPLDQIETLTLLDLRVHYGLSFVLETIVTQLFVEDLFGSRSYLGPLLHFLLRSL
jgi:hypothetical protein